MSDTKLNRIPDPLITCLLPEYEDRHIWWLILQYLQESGFNHTASAFTLELTTKGFKGDELKTLSKEDLHKHIKCLLTRQLVGPKAAAALLPRSGGAAAKETGKGKGTPQKPGQQEKASKKQQATPSAQKSGCISPMDIDQRHPQRLDQSEHEKHLDRQQQQKTPTRPAGSGHQQKKQSLATTQQQSIAAAATEMTAVRQQEKSPAAGAGAPASSAVAPAARAAAVAQSPAAVASTSPAAAAPAPAAATGMAPAAAVTASAATAVPMLNVRRLPSVTATGEGEETLDFGDAEDEEAAPVAGMLHDEHGEEPTVSEAVEEGEHREEDQDQLQEEVAERKHATGHEGDGQPSSTEELQQQPSRLRAPSSDGRPQLKRGKPFVTTAPALPAHSDGKSRSHSRSRGRSTSRSRGGSHSRKHSSDRSHSRSHSRSSSRSKNRRRSYSRSRRSRSRSRSYGSRSRSMSRDRGRSKSRSRSRDRDRERDSVRYHRSGYQSHWQTNRQGGSSYQGRGGSSYNGTGGYNKYGPSRGGGRGFVTYHTNNKYDSQDPRGGGEYGTASYNNHQRGRGRGRYDFNSNSRGGRAAYQQQRGQGRPVYITAHNSLRVGEHDGPTRAPYHHSEGSEEGEALPHHMAHSGSAPPEHPASHPGSDGGPAGGSAGEHDRDVTGAPHGARSGRSPDDDGDYNRGCDRGLVQSYSFGRGRGRGGRGGFGRQGAATVAARDDHWQGPAADGAAEADGIAAAPKAVGKEGGKFDWPPRDASGKPILNAIPAAVGVDKTGGRLGARRQSMPVEDRGHWGGSGGRGPRERFVQPGAGRRPLTLTLKSGLAVSDSPGDGEGDAGGGSGALNIDNDRWRADDDERGSRSQSRERSPKSGGGVDRDAGHALEPQQEQFMSSEGGGATNREGSPSHTAAITAAAGGMSGAHVVAKRRISGTGGAMITDLSGATSQDSPCRGGGVASTADTDAAGGPTKKLRASSPGVQS